MFVILAGEQSHRLALFEERTGNSTADIHFKSLQLPLQYLVRHWMTVVMPWMETVVQTGDMLYLVMLAMTKPHRADGDRGEGECLPGW